MILNGHTAEDCKRACDMRIRICCIVYAASRDIVWLMGPHNYIKGVVVDPELPHITSALRTANQRLAIVQGE